MIFFAIPLAIIAFVFIRALFSSQTANGPRSFNARPDIDQPVYMPMDEGVTLITAQMIQDDAAIGDTHQDGQGYNDTNSPDNRHGHNGSNSPDSGHGYDDSNSTDSRHGYNDSNSRDNGHDHSSSTDQGGNDPFWSDPGFGSTPSDAPYSSDSSSSSDSSFSSDSSWSSDSSFGGGASDSSCGSSDSF